MSKPEIKRLVNGQIVLQKDDFQYILNPKNITTSRNVRKNLGTSESAKSLFKLVTVRRLTEQSAEQIAALLKASQINLEAAALASGQPVPYPTPPPSGQEEKRDFYGVFIDEDLPGGKVPVYTFFSPSSKIRAFITATDSSREGWSLNIIHYTNITDNGNGSKTTNWRIYTLDNRLNNKDSKNSYILDSTTLPEAYNYSYDINSVDFLGGGCWSGLVNSREDKISVIGRLPKFRTDDNYRLIEYNQIIKRAKVVLYHTTTPTYSFTWCRGQLVVNTRLRNASHTYNPNQALTTGVIETNFKSNYELNITFRPELTYGDVEVSSKHRKEFSNSTATYIGNTNLEINSPFQSPDYGTDKPMYALQRYTQETSVLRPVKNNWEFGGVAFSSTQQPPINTVLAATPDMKFFITAVQPDAAYGSINHPYETKYMNGQRGIQHYWFYKNWWAYGRVLDVYHIPGTEFVYKQSRVGSYETREYIRLFSFFDIGELRLHPTIPNAIETTWQEDNPSALFIDRQGIMQFVLVFSNPPLIGHQGILYYEKQPIAVDSADIADSRVDNFGEEAVADKQSAGFSMVGNLTGGYAAGGNDPLSQLQGLQDIYNQIIGQTTGQFVPSINIGNVNITNDAASVILTRPTESQSLILSLDVDLFPNGFNNRYRTLIANNANEIVDIRFDKNSLVKETYKTQSVVELYI